MNASDGVNRNAKYQKPYEATTMNSVTDHLTQTPPHITNADKYDREPDGCERERATGIIDSNSPKESAPFSTREELDQHSNPQNPLRSKTILPSEVQLTNVEKRMQQ